MAGKIGYRWHLRRLMADKNMYATTQLRPLLAERGVALSREQVYRLVTGVPVTRRWTWEADSVMPRSASGGISSVVLNMPCAAITSRSRHR